MATGTAQLLFGATHRRHGGLLPYWTLWLFEDHRSTYWRTEQGPRGPVSWVPRSRDRMLSDALVMLVALTTTPRDPVPTALTDMSGGIPWDHGSVDVSTWRRYDAALLDALVAETEPAGKLVLSLLPESSLLDVDVLDRLDWDHDVLMPTKVKRRADRDIHQAPPPRTGAPRPAPPSGVRPPDAHPEQAGAGEELSPDPTAGHAAGADGASPSSGA